MSQIWCKQSFKLCVCVWTATSESHKSGDSKKKIQQVSLLPLVACFPCKGTTTNVRLRGGRDVCRPRCRPCHRFFKKTSVPSFPPISLSPPPPKPYLHQLQALISLCPSAPVESKNVKLIFTTSAFVDSPFWVQREFCTSEFWLKVFWMCPITPTTIPILSNTSFSIV